MIYSEGCILCGKELVYTKENTVKDCVYCGKKVETNVRCPDGHFVCDSCHSTSAFDLIENFCNHTDLTDPMQIAVMLMKHQHIKMHGPEHHYLVPAALLAAYYNFIGNSDVRPYRMRAARKRAEQVPGGFCGSHGNCGAAVGAGIFISVITGATPLAEEEWQISNRMTAMALLAIADKGGPRCCKRDSYTAIYQAVTFLKNKMNIEMPLSKVECSFSERNKQCKFEACEYNPVHLAN
jgi:hypothetical protein